MTAFLRLTTLGLASLTAVCLMAAPRTASAESFFDDFCDVRWVDLFIPCPQQFDNYDFYWRPVPADNTTAELAEARLLGRPGDAESWVTLVKPATSYFFYEPMPASKEGSDGWVGVLGSQYRWWPAEQDWDFGDGSGSGIHTLLLSSLFAVDYQYPRSSYGQVYRNPAGEPGFQVRAHVSWGGRADIWHPMCSFPPLVCWIQDDWILLAARKTREHVVSVRQVLPMGFGR